MQSKKIVKFMETLGKLKTTRRAGWINQTEIKNPESVADHSYRCTFLAMCVGDLGKTDTEKLIRMMLLHDMQEALTGDYDYSKKKKIGIGQVKQNQRIAISKMIALLPEELQEYYSAIWNEFENESSPEAIIAHDIDKIELVMQALEYEKQGINSLKLDIFWSNVENQIETQEIQNLFNSLLKIRQQLRSQSQ